MTIHAPYNFVPLSDQVVLPEWADLVSHDVPFRDGLSGSFEITVINETELLVGDGASRPASGGDQRRKEMHDVRPFRLPDGRAAIPGSSLRGMIRAVLEIATFSRFRQVDDSRFGVRDLTSAAKRFYRAELAPEVEGKAKARAQAGWLSFRDGKWMIEPCEYARVEHDDLEKLTGDSWWHEVKRGPAANKYKQWEQTQGKNNLGIWFAPVARGETVETIALQQQSGLTEGTLVFTGQPGDRKRDPKEKSKRKDYVFFNARSAVPVGDDVMRGFLFIHEKSEDWKRVRNDRRIPVFFIEREEGIASLGLALMFKLAYRHSVHEVIARQNQMHTKDGAPDFADLLFGKTDQRENGSLKARAWFEPAVADGKVDALPPQIRVLASPKPSYYPSYVRQKASNGNLDGDYTSWSDGNALLRGWKRYPSRTTLNEGHPATDPVISRLHALPRGCRFKGRVIFHNLRREELGALLWALTWGGDPALHHGLGMGKPYGYGAVRIEIDETQIASALQWNDVKRQEPNTVHELRESFTSYMAERIPSWSETPQMTALLAMADPAKAAGVDLRYMKLEPRGENEFQIAKNARPPQVLPEFPGVPSVPSHAVVIDMGAPNQEGRGAAKPDQKTKPATGAEETNLPLKRRESQTGATVEATLLADTTKKGGSMFRIGETDETAVLSPRSPKPPEGTPPGTTLKFMVAASGTTPQLWYLDPAGPAPAISNKKNGEKPRRSR